MLRVTRKAHHIARPDGEMLRRRATLFATDSNLPLPAQNVEYLFRLVMDMAQFYHADKHLGHFGLGATHHKTVRVRGKAITRGLGRAKGNGSCPSLSRGDVETAALRARVVSTEALLAGQSLPARLDLRRTVFPLQGRASQAALS